MNHPGQPPQQRTRYRDISRLVVEFRAQPYIPSPTTVSRRARDPESRDQLRRGRAEAHAKTKQDSRSKAIEDLKKSLVNWFSQPREHDYMTTISPFQLSSLPNIKIPLEAYITVQAHHFASRLARLLLH
ncbi:hypothetical protein LZ554_008309 [Drepanopeziza brunnea f. sp. 'monogermtubi']|nr:hypothetical protein LZ554_008309 [Drepanopeziza brunnea f. sp. 'monogermtubi']